jgi:hypothetical protein
VALVSELELPTFDYTDPSMRGERFHQAMRELRAGGWLAQAPFGFMTLDRESGEFFLRTRSAIFPGMKIAEIFGVTEGPLYEQMLRNILHVNGADHSRLRSLVNPALSPRAVERYRPAMREFLEQLLAASIAVGDSDSDSDGDGGTPGRSVFGRGAVLERGLDGSRRRAPASTGAEQLGLERGDRVVHGTWGEGAVVEVSGSGEDAEAVVQFASVGRKKLLLRMAPLKRA